MNAPASSPWMLPSLPLRGAECPDAEALEALAAQRDDFAGPTGAHVQRCDACRPYVTSLRVAQASFRRARPPERILGQLVRRKDGQQRRAARLRWSFFTAASAAAVLLLTLLGAPAEVMRKGGGFTAVYRRGEGLPERVVEDVRLRSGDALRFFYLAPRAGYVAILDLDGEGKPAVVYPFGGLTGAPIEKDQRAALPNSLVLDAAQGAEHFISVFSPEPVALAPLLEQLRRVGHGSPPRLSCRGCQVDVLRVQKDL